MYGGLTGAALALGVLLIAAGLWPSPAAVAVRWGWPTWRRRLRGAGSGRRAAVGVAAGAAVGLATEWPVAVFAVTAAVLAAPRLAPGRAVERQLSRLDGLETWTRRLADILGAGAGGLEQAIQASVRTCPVAIRADVSVLAAGLAVRGVEAALREFADDLADVGSPAPDMVAAALILRVRRGGRGLRPVLVALAEDVADLVRARRTTEAERARPRANARTLSGLTLVVLTATLLFARGYLAPFGTGGGQAMLAVIAGLFAVAFWLIARITRPRRPARLFGPSSTVDYSEAPSWT